MVFRTVLVARSSRVHFEVQGSISSSRAPFRGPRIQEAPERFPNLITTRICSKMKGDLLSYSRDLTTTRVCSKMVLKSAIFEVLQGPNHH